MIKGITHDDDGKVKQKLPVIGKVATGEAPNEDRKYPKAVDHFVLKKRKEIGNDIEWVQDDDLMKEFDDNMEPDEISITLLSNDIEDNFKSSLQWWKADHLHCYGDGETGHRWDDGEEERYELDCPCPKLENGPCSPNGQLKFSILSDEAQIGGVHALYTTSKQTIRQIYTNLKSIKGYTSTAKCPDGRLRGIPLRLKLNPSKTKFKDKKGKTRSTIHYFPYIAFHPSDLEDSELIDVLKDKLGAIDQIDSVTNEEDEDFEDIDVDEFADDEDEEIFGEFVE